MKTLNLPSLNDVNHNSRQILDKVKSKIGMIPNIFAAMGHSDKLLGGFLTFQETIKSGAFSNKEYEVIALVTSQENSCEYCLSAHTALAKLNGFSEQDTLDLRTQSIEDQKLWALASLVSELVRSHGHPLQATIENFFSVGYSKAAFAELIGVVGLTTITNYVFHNGGFEIDFPKAQLI